MLCAHATPANSPRAAIFLHSISKQTSKKTKISNVAAAACFDLTFLSRLRIYGRRRVVGGYASQQQQRIRILDQRRSILYVLATHFFSFCFYYYLILSTISDYSVQIPVKKIHTNNESFLVARSLNHFDRRKMFWRRNKPIGRPHSAVLWSPSPLMTHRKSKTFRARRRRRKCVIITNKRKHAARLFAG